MLEGQENPQRPEISLVLSLIPSRSQRTMQIGRKMYNLGHREGHRFSIFFSTVLEYKASVFRYENIGTLNLFFHLFYHLE